MSVCIINRCRLLRFPLSFIIIFSHYCIFFSAQNYKKYLPVSEKTPVITLLEGNTPLIPARNLAEKIGFPGTIYFKYEGLNPTGSFKDRGMVMAVAKAIEGGAKALVCASTGNTSASAAAYAAAAGIPCYVLLPAGKVALGKLAQALMYGAKVIAVDRSAARLKRCMICRRVRSSSAVRCLTSCLRLV